MDSELNSAAKEGDVSFLSLALSQKRTEDRYFISQTDEGDNMIHLAVRSGKEEFISEAFKKLPSLVQSLICHKNYQGHNPLHVSAKFGNLSVAKLLVDAYNAVQASPSSPMVGAMEEGTMLQPWRAKDLFGQYTPLHTALDNGHDQFGLYMLSLDADLANVVARRDTHDKAPLFLAVKTGCERVVEKILESGFAYSLSGYRGKTPLHVASCCSERLIKLLLEKMPDEQIGKWDWEYRTALECAAEDGAEWLVRLLLIKSNNFSIVKSAPKALIIACQKHNLAVAQAICDNCPDLLELCYDMGLTPLHYLQYKKEEEYRELLRIDQVNQLKNVKDHKGATSLHHALSLDDIVLAEVLLTTDGVDRTVRDSNGKTALNLLKERSSKNKEWEEMCNRIGVFPRPRTSYILTRTKMEGMRNTMSVVAALLATITFAAAFTIPGGFDDKGDAIIARKASFIVFMLSDTYAMCCSMSVLFCLIWAMVLDPDDKALVLVDRSVFVLQHSFYGTLVAFMAGTYAMVSHKSLGVAIAICVMCSCVPIWANQRVLFRLLDKLVPTAGSNFRSQ